MSIGENTDFEELYVMGGFSRNNGFYEWIIGQFFASGISGGLKRDYPLGEKGLETPGEFFPPPQVYPCPQKGGYLCDT
jgi:hypothetical protein